MNQIEKVTTPNSRLLYLELPRPFEDWQQTLWRIDSYIGSNDHLQLANDGVYQYFFHSGEDDLFWKSKSWLGREVVGLPRPLEPGYAFYDLDGFEVFRKNLSFNFDQPLSPKELIDNEIFVRHHLEVEYAGPMATTWRIFTQQKGEYEWEIGLDFFKKKKL